MENIILKLSSGVLMMMGFIMVAPHAYHAQEVFQAIVAQDGSGNYTTISDAVLAAPNNSATRYIIKIQAGVYEEQVFVGKEKQKLMFIGDGVDNTIITNNRSKDTGCTLEDSATVDINGDNFIAKSITFTNSAGPELHQAVALRTTSNYSAFYMCNFSGYQDTLYAKKGYQFFRDCNIYGSTDFIFGSAAVVFQKCNIYLHSKNNSDTVITAQGKDTKTKGSSGISIHMCHIQGSPDYDFKSGKQTFLGRPWKGLSTVVYMESTLDGIIHPQGWEPFNDEPPSSSIFYGEYKNIGIGSNTTGRVVWAIPGTNMTRLEAENFTVRNWIQGNLWLGETQIPFDLDLLDV